MRFTPSYLSGFQGQRNPKQGANHKVYFSIRVLTFAIVAIALIVGTRQSQGHRRVAEFSARDSQTEPTSLQVNSNPIVQALPIQLKFEGFFPREIRRRAGYYYIAVSNVSRERDIRLRFDRQDGERMYDVNLTRQRPWRQTVLLTPGTYLITVANHPRWVCRITVIAL